MTDDAQLVAVAVLFGLWAVASTLVAIFALGAKMAAFGVGVVLPAVALLAILGRDVGTDTEPAVSETDDRQPHSN